MRSSSQQALVKGEQRLVDFEDVVVPVGDEILHDIAIEKTDAGLIESMGYSAEDDECLTRATIHYNSTMP